MMQAIQVKFKPATDTAGEFFIASCPGGSLVFPYDYAHSSLGNEILAAQALLEKMEWHYTHRLSEPGGLPNDITVFTLIERDNYLCGNPECGREIETVGTWKYGANGSPLWDQAVCKVCEPLVLEARLKTQVRAGIPFN